MQGRITFIALILTAALAFAVFTSVKTEAEVQDSTTTAMAEKPATTATTEKPAVEETAEAPAPEESLLSAPAGLTIDVATVMKDRVIGNPDAPVTIIEYASMTCSHCAHFHNSVLPEVKKALLETGKAKLIFRDFPLDAFALRAAMMARCAPAERYFDLVEVIFKNQERWTKSDDPLTALKQYGALSGMDADYIDACMNNEAFEKAILESQQDGQKKFAIKATPTFVFNDGKESFSGAQNLEVFSETVQKLTTK